MITCAVVVQSETEDRIRKQNRLLYEMHALFLSYKRSDVKRVLRLHSQKMLVYANKSL